MANQTVQFDVRFYSCYIPEVDPAGSVAPLPNPVLPYPTELPTPVIIPADCCSALIYKWLGAYQTSKLTPAAVALREQVKPTAFDTIDAAAYAADLAAIAAKYAADVAQAIADHQAAVDAGATDYQERVAKRLADIAACEATRYPKPPTVASGVTIKVATSKIASSTPATTSQSGLRAALKLSYAAA